MQTQPRLKSFEDWQAAYPISFEDYCDSLAYQRDFIKTLTQAIRKATDGRKIEYLNNLQAGEQATYYAIVRNQRLSN